MEDKPLVIHIKQKTQIHSHKSKNPVAKGRNIYTVNRNPKVKAVTFNKKSGKVRNGSTKFRIQKGKKTSLSIKGKQTTLHIVGRAGVIGAKVTTDQLDGGKDFQQAVYMANEVLRPLTGTASYGASVFPKQVMEQKKRRIKKVEVGKKLAKKPATKATKNAVKGSVTKATKESVKKASKFAAKTATTTTTTAAGSVGGSAGIAIGMATGYASGVAIERKDTQMANRNRKLAFFLDKMKAQENQQDSIVKLVKDLITRRALLWIKTVAPVIGLVLLLLVLVVAMITIPVIAIVAVIYNSPFALFLPPLEAGDSVQSVASGYVAEFNRDVNTLANEHIGYDIGQIVYVDYEGMDATPSNYYDILAVYMVKYGVGDTASIMNATSKEWLKSVVDDMCSYTASTGSETVTVTNEDGTFSTTTTTYLYVNVTLKSYRDMIYEYGFDRNEVEMLEEMMSPDYLSMLGWSDGGGSGEPGVGSLTESEISSILAGISNGTQRAVCSFALHRVGYPYSQELRDSGNYYDCSSLAYYSWRSAGVNISNGGATTASAEGQKLDEAGKTVSFGEMQPGDLIFYSYTNNGRYKNISHVAIYVGGGKVVEARSEEYGVVYRDVPNIGSIVLIGRP